jgi:ATP-binding cassette subfamily C (CFTR/MRP) protein 1
VLGANGQIAQQGTYDKLRQQDGFIQSILLHPAPSSNETFLDAKNMNGDTKPSTKEATVRDQAQDLARRTGDMAVYGYYMKSIGWRKATVFAGFSALAVFASSFSRRLQVSLATLDATNEYQRSG